MKGKTLLLATLLCLMGSALGCVNVSADDAEMVMEKWSFAQYYQCIRDNYINSPIKPKNVSQYQAYAADDVMQASGKMFLPSYLFQHQVNSGYANCKQMFLGGDGLSKGALGYGGISRTDTDWAHEPQTYLKMLGYEQEDTGTTTFNIKAHSTLHNDHSPRDGAEDDVYSLYMDTDGKGHYNMEYNYLDSLSYILEIGFTGDNQVYIRINSGKLDVLGYQNCSILSSRNETTVPLYVDPQKTFSEIENALLATNWSTQCVTFEGDTSYSWWADYSFTKGEVVYDRDKYGEFIFPSSSGKRYTATNNAVNKLSGIGGLRDIKLSSSERQTLYHHYLKKSTEAFGGVDCQSVDPPSDSVEVKLKYKDKIKMCFAKFGGKNPASIKVYTLEHNGSYPYVTQITMADVINWLNNVPADEMIEFDPGNESGASCVNSSAANSLGWIICPITEWLSEQAEKLYDEAVKPSLGVKPQLFTGKGDSTRQGWETFRNFADIVFIILLLVVIFSQITGVGIDNYEIKKILPKLIIAAILINLSYWICVAFVDLSNILGNAFQVLFDSLASGVTSTSNNYVKATAADAFSSGGGATIVSLVIVSGLLGVVVMAGVLNPAILLALFVAVLGVAISIFFLFILLSVRQAAIVVLVVLSPLAVVCYMLPNTKFLFDKWLKLFGALLLVYPICGLLIGGGNYVSKLLLAAGVADNGIFGAITSVVVGIVPIFFIPTVLRKSFSAMGQLGGRISSMGQTVSGAATRGIRGSTLYKGAQERGQERRTRIKAGYDRQGNRVTGFRKAGARVMNFGSSRNMQRNALRYRKNISEQGALAAADLPGFMDDVYTQQEMDRITASDEFNNFNDLQNGLRNALETDNAAQIRAYTNILANKGENGRDAIKNAWNQANVSGNGISNSAAATFGNNILNNHSSFKSDARSLFDTATNAAAGTRNDAGRFNNTNELSANSLAMSATSGSMASMDDAEFAQTFLGGAGNYTNEHGELIGSVNLDGLDDSQREAVARNAINALETNENINANRRAYLEKIRDSVFPSGTQSTN